MHNRRQLLICLNQIHRRSYMSAHDLLNLLNEQERDKMRGLPVRHGSSPVAKVVYSDATIVTRFITAHPRSLTGMNRPVRSGQ